MDAATQKKPFQRFYSSFTVEICRDAGLLAKTSALDTDSGENWSTTSCSTVSKVSNGGRISGQKLQQPKATFKNTSGQSQPNCLRKACSSSPWHHGMKNH
jgi:hypothetical protein